MFKYVLARFGGRTYVGIGIMDEIGHFYLMNHVKSPNGC